MKRLLPLLALLAFGSFNSIGYAQKIANPCPLALHDITDCPDTGRGNVDPHLHRRRNVRSNYQTAEPMTTPQTVQSLSFEGKSLRLIKRIGDGVVFFFENEDPVVASPATPTPPPVRLAPITEVKQIDFETGNVTIPGGTLNNFFLVDVYLRQRYFYRNDGQNFFRAFTFPVIEIESVIFNNLNDPVTGTPLNGKLKITLNGLHLDAGKTLVAGERGNDSRGNKDSFLFSSEFFDLNFGPGIAKDIFKNDLTIHIKVENSVQGLNHFVAGTFTKVFGD